MKQRALFVLLLWGALSLVSPWASGRSEGSIRKTWDYAAGIRTVVVDADEQDIVVKAGGARVTGRVIGDAGDEVRVTREGDNLTVTVRSGKAWFEWRHKTSRVELTVPADLNLDLTTASGAILVRTPSADLKARSASGDIEAPRGGAAADVDSASGTVRLAGFSGPVKASTLSGDLLLEDLQGVILANTLSGDLAGTNLTPEDRSRFSTVSGDIRIRLTPGLEGYTVEGESVSGAIELGEARGDDKLISGTGPRSLIVKTVSGDVWLR